MKAAVKDIRLWAKERVQRAGKSGTVSVSDNPVI